MANANFIKNILIVLGGAIVVGLTAFGFAQLQHNTQTQTNLSAQAPAAGEDLDETAPIAQIDVAAALSDRVLGDTSAPVKISEHSSFTCGHCGAFHKTTFKALKSNYIDTGRAYLVFSDFPLNAPALHASMVARCLPHDRYFDFVQMLFETQDDWAYERNYMDRLQSKAADYGMDQASFKACIDNEDLREGILSRVQFAQTQWEINSTPSFVINNKTVLSGGRPIEEFDKAINEAAAE